ncbi:AraC family transcriptional regulator [Paenibacillus campinasensis]|nr:AraC family transcriptional regulator [Paenibacillus campinasensis]
MSGSAKSRDKRFMRKKVFMTLLLSYLMILLFPGAVFTAVYNRIEDVMVDNANKLNQTLIEQAQQIVDSKLEEMYQLSRNITSHPDMKALLNIEGINNGKENYAFYKFMEEIQRYKNNNRFVRELYIYFRNSDTILTSGLKTDSDLFYSKLYSYDHMTYEEWKEQVLHAPHYNTFLPVAQIGRPADKSDMLTYVQSLPVGERSSPQGALVMLIDKRQIYTWLEEITRSNQGSIYIKDAGGQVLLHAESGEETPLMPGESLSKISVSAYSAESGWEYVSAVPDEVFWGRVQTVKNLAFSVLFFYLVAGIGACAFLTYRAYQPVREIIRLISDKKHPGHTDYGNEYEYIKTAVEDVFLQKDAMRDKLQEQVPVLRSHFLLRLLKGNVDSEAVSEHSLAFMGIDFPHPYYGVALIKLCGMDEGERGNTEKVWALMRFLTGQLVEDNRMDHFHCVELDKDMVAVIFNVPDPGLHQAEIYPWLETIQDTIRRRFNTGAIIALSDLHSGMEQVPMCLDESMKALDYSIFTENQSVLVYDDMKHKSELVYDFPVDTEVRIIQAVKNGETVKVEQLIESLYRNNFNMEHKKPELARLLFANLVSTLFKLLNGLNLKYDELFKQDLNPLEVINKADTVHDMYTFVLSLFHKVCRQVSAKRMSSSSAIVDKAKVYLEQNADDAMLSLASVAEHFQITPQYLSGLFKKSSGINMSDYLAQVRIKKAKELMSDPDITISQIARLVGYNNDVGFIRVFKKHEGMTPGQYRTLMENK